jgi:glycine reductase
METRLLFYLNQFFAGVGAEDKADVPPDSRKGAIGPGKRLQALLGDRAQIAVSVFCGDNYFASHRDEVLQKVKQITKEEKINIVVAGPAFMAGRYGFACTEICHWLANELGLDCVSAMHAENAGMIGYKKYRDRKVFLIPTADTTQGMEDALSRMAKFVTKLAFGAVIGPAAEEGYLSRGIRLTEPSPKQSAARAVEMLLAKLNGKPFISEIPITTDEVVPIAPAIKDMKNAVIAIVTTSGLVAEGNPDKFKAVSNTKWGKYSIKGMSDMKQGKWDVVHGGYDTVYMKADPNYGVPLDMVKQFEASREFEKEGTFARLYPYFYSSTGVGGITSVMQRIGREIAQDMKAEGIKGALMVST